MTFHQLLMNQLGSAVISTVDELAAVHLVEQPDSLRHVASTALRCESIGFGFAVGYRSALQALLPALDSTRWAAMCVTEAAGNHPRNIQCAVNDQGLLQGEKSFVTMAEFKPQLLVVAKAGDGENTPILKACLVDSAMSGVNITMMPPLPMVPEIGHGKISFDNVQGQVLPGDGYAEYSKRFRTIEDVHVLTAFVSVLVSIAYRHGCDASVIEKGILLLASLMQTQASLHSDHPVFHVHLAAAFDEFRQLCKTFEANMDGLPETIKANWFRDKKLFGVANTAREARKIKARTALNLTMD